MKTVRITPVLVAAALVLATCFTAYPADTSRFLPAPFQEPVKTGVLTDPDIAEVSGIAASGRPEPVLWVINDSGNPPTLYGVSQTGRLIARFHVKGANNIDWEDLATFRYNGHHYLIIADVGDNRAQRKVYTLYFVQVPDIEPPAGRTAPANGQVTVQWQLQFMYPDGPRDCESVAVDETGNKILLLSKRDPRPVLFELPLARPARDVVHTATPVAQLATLPRPTAQDLVQKYGRQRSRPTSMDITADGTALIILTYKHAYLYHRPKGGDWQTAFDRQPEIIGLPLPETFELVQREALCINRATGQILVTTEQLPAPIYTLTPAD